MTEPRTNCTGKVAFESAILAHQVNRRHKVRRRSVYRCTTCGFWHLGTPHRVIEHKLRQLDHDH